MAIATLSSCLKDDGLVLDPDKGTNVIEFSNVSEIAIHGSTTALYNVAYPIQTAIQSVPVSVNYSGPADGAPEDITVNIGMADASVITQYNTENTKNYVMMDAGTYTVNATSVKIPKGQKSATFTVSFNTSLFVLSKNYVLPLKITSVSSGTISGNFGTILLNIAGKNQYDGIYSHSAGFFQRYSSPTTPTTNDALNGTMEFNADLTLSTIDANTVQVGNLRWGSTTGAGSPTGVGGIDFLQIVIDPTTNAVTMKSTTNLTLANTPGQVNKWDPATKTFTLNFDWNQTAAKREVKGLIIKYKGSR